MDGLAEALECGLSYLDRTSCQSCVSQPDPTQLSCGSYRRRKVARPARLSPIASLCDLPRSYTTNEDPIRNRNVPKLPSAAGRQTTHVSSSIAERVTPKAVVC